MRLPDPLHSTPHASPATIDLSVHREPLLGAMRELGRKDVIQVLFQEPISPGIREVTHFKRTAAEAC